VAETTEISWTDMTFNPWWGCEKVSPACRGCYAERDAHRYRPDVTLWGPGSVRQVASDAYWRGPLKWARAARAAGVRKRVFCASMADVFEAREDLDAPRARLWALIEATPELDWLLLTKRPENVASMVPAAWLAAVDPRRLVAMGWPRNVILGTTVEDQEHAELRIPHLLRVPARTRFLSVEPLLGHVAYLDRYFFLNGGSTAGPFSDALGRRRGGGGPGGQMITSIPSHDIAWVIVGGESGPGARPMDPEWARAVRDACIGGERAFHGCHPGVAFHFKQWGEWGPAHPGGAARVQIVDMPGGTMHRVGKKAGRELDGRTWDEFYAPPAAAPLVRA
jgi:protein gp37